jgi:hypothetical protein
MQWVPVKPEPTLSWLGREGSNLRMSVPKTDALPLGYAPLDILTSCQKKLESFARLLQIPDVLIAYTSIPAFSNSSITFSSIVFLVS